MTNKPPGYWCHPSKSKKNEKKNGRRNADDPLADLHDCDCIPSSNSWQNLNLHNRDIDLFTLTRFLLQFFLLPSACPQTDTAQLYNTQPDLRARTSGSNRPWVTCVLTNIMGVAINYVSTGKEAGAEYLFLTVVHSFTFVRSRIQDKRHRWLILESIRKVEHDSNMTEDELFHACAVQNPFLSLGRLAQQGTGVIFVQILEHCSCLTRPRRNEATQLHKEESLFFGKGTLVAPLSTAGVSDEVVQELQMPMGPQMLEDVEEPMPARLATLRDPGTPDQIVMEQHNLNHFPS